MAGVTNGVSLERVIKRYGETQVIHGVDLEIAEGELCVFVGPSGCGKSTLLRMIAGLEETTDGRIVIAGEDVTRADPSERGVAMVFQTYALYPHMSVAENMGFGLKMTGHPKEEIARRVGEAARVLQLEPYLERKPKALSGGQRQRVAIGRAIVRDPSVFLFDEPLSNLDAELRVEMRVEIAHLHKSMGATMIYVTHDQVEAMTLADKIVVLRAGRVEQVGAPLALYQDPDNRFVAGFIGSPSMNFLDGRAEAGGVAIPALGRTIETAVRPRDGAVTVGLRPEDLTLAAGETLVVDIVENLGSVCHVHCDAGHGTRLVVETRGVNAPRPGARVDVAVDPARVYLFDPQSGARLR
ncbi:ABC transporter ATP-binding protein [Salinarimonas ramus]|uniref:Sugar ABC transporter ATP-binding protein n=1 Tax=Salinarimonas ramus TaxID=690164 RepID=A0A917VA70_9HYPH|nr:sn-glycerol-3-phosphate ABC transporter ATP-binding protein UgpC [Salinarimonas ramus]GGK53727.1 sugar ABC transporter ATP-binding protein [Salinarimonas ramus]